MHRLKGMVVAFHHDTRGATATEYLILLILVACLIIAVVRLFGRTLMKKFWAASEVVNKKVTLPSS